MNVLLVFRKVFSGVILFSNTLIFSKVLAMDTLLPGLKILQRSLFTTGGTLYSRVSSLSVRMVPS